MTVNKEIVVGSLKELADKGYQERLWLASSGDEISSLTEAVCQLFDDSGLGDALDRNNRVYGDPVDHMLRQLDGILRQLPRNTHPSIVIDDPKMEMVRNLASRVLSLIDKQ